MSRHKTTIRRREGAPRPSPAAGDDGPAAPAAAGRPTRWEWAAVIAVFAAIALLVYVLGRDAPAESDVRPTSTRPYMEP